MTEQLHITENRDAKSTWRYSLIAAGIPADTVDDFLSYHKENPQVWKEFERLTLQVAALGKRKGAKAIYERIRWDVEIEQDSEFKCNNNYAAYYARAFELKHPNLQGFFEFRTITGLKEVA